MPDILAWFRQPRVKPGVTHDLRRRGWGHDYTFTPQQGGREAGVMGWLTPRPEVGGYLLLQDGSEPKGLLGAQIQKDSGTRYQVIQVTHFSNPNDMFSARVHFAPRLTPEDFEAPIVGQDSPYV